MLKSGQIRQIATVLKDRGTYASRRDVTRPERKAEVCIHVPEKKYNS